GGRNWTPMESCSPEGKIAAFINTRADSRVLYALVERPSAYDFCKSMDAGQSWERADAVIAKDVYRLAEFADLVADPANSSTLYATLAERMFRSTDGGKSWEKLPDICNRLCGRLAIHPTAPSAIYRGSADGDIRLSTDGGKSWKIIGLVSEEPDLV